MASEITASSMGQAIGLGYRTKDIGPQLMQFQASELARRSAEKNAAKKEKKAEYDKTLDKIIDLSGADVHKVFREELNKIADDAKAKVTKFNNEGDYEGMKTAIFDMTKAVSDYKLKTTNLRGIETAASTGTQLVPNDIISTFSGNKFVEIPIDNQEYMLSLGWEVDPLNRMYTNKAGFKPKDTLNEIMTSPMPTKEVLMANGSVVEFKKDPSQAGFSESGSDVYVPTPQYWDSVVNAKLQDPEFVANELKRITHNDGKSYAKVAAEKRAAMAAPTGADPKSFSILEVNRAIVKENLDNEIRDTWIKNHTLSDTRNVAPKVTTSGNNNKNNKNQVNPTSVIGSEHLESAVRDQINKDYKEFKDYTDRQLIDIARKDAALLSPQEKKIRGFFDNIVNVQKKELAHTRYPTVQVALKTDNLTPPSLKDKTLKKLDEIYYNTDKQQFYARFSTTAAESGATAQVLEKEIPLTVADLQYLRSATGNEPTLKTAFDNLDGNAAAGRYETIDGYITRNSTGVGSRAGMTRISQAQYNKGFADSKKAMKANNGHVLTKEEYDALLATNNKYR